MARIVVITGATGNIGGKLRAHLAARADYVLRLIDVDPRGDAAILEADLGTFSEHWTRAFAGADAVVHLAAHPNPTVGWNELAGPNVDAALHVYLAAAAHGVKRVVLASSVWVMAARFNDGDPILAGEPSPGANAYGTAKMFAERIGKAFAQAHGISTVALRLGTCRPGANEPSPTPTEWDDECWISNRDICDGIERAIRADINGFVAVNLTSANAGSRWSLEEARDHLGYHAADGHRAAPLPASTPADPPEQPGLFARLRGTRRSGGR